MPEISRFFGVIIGLDMRVIKVAYLDGYKIF